LERALGDCQPGQPVQFERKGYFVADSKDSSPQHLVFNRAVTLKDTWAKVQTKNS
jgi:glutaminyl-tRNA synthetase